MNDIFGANERERLAHRGLASRFPFARGPSPERPSSGNVAVDPGYLDMNLDFHETKEGFELTADLPGMTQDDISVDVDTESGVLTVSGERKHEEEGKRGGDDGGKKYHLTERPHGTMTRSIRLPEAADTANATAGYAAGVLTVTFPKRDSQVSKRLRIPVSGNASRNDAK
ncbi:unnamed protein product, partial [Hapterophycus canaliculatus]